MSEKTELDSKKIIEGLTLRVKQLETELKELKIEYQNLLDSSQRERAEYVYLLSNHRKKSY